MTEPSPPASPEPEPPPSLAPPPEALAPPPVTPKPTPLQEWAAAVAIILVLLGLSYMFLSMLRSARM